MKEYIMRYENEVLQLLPNKMQELVRCKDCVHWDELTQSCDEIDGIFLPNWFCADGERKDESS